jgi:hypothetical protein
VNIDISDRAVAVSAAGLGTGPVPVFPCRADKTPASRHGFKDASAEPVLIRRLFGVPGAALIGMPTGEPSRIVAIDIDPDAFDWFQRRDKLGLFGATRRHRTPRAGVHLFYRHRSLELRNSAGKLARGCDIRGQGGYAILPPSPGYIVLCASPPAPMPAWVIAALTPAPRLQRRHQAASSSPNRLARFVAAGPIGERNNRLFWAACRPDADITSLLAAALAAGLPESEAARTIASARRATAAD